jgi:hypothetical protein
VNGILQEENQKEKYLKYTQILKNIIQNSKE